MTSNERYRALKKSLSNQKIRGYPLDRVLGSYIAASVWLPIAYRLRFLVSLMRRKPNIREGHYETLMTFYEKPRGDYNEIVHFYKSRKKNEQLHAVAIKTVSRSPSEWLHFFSLVLSELRCSNASSLMDDLLLAYLKAFARMTIDALESKNITCRNYISFNSSYLFESFLCFLFSQTTSTYKFASAWDVF